MPLITEAGNSSGSSTALDVVAWIAIPLFLALAGAVFGIVKGAIRFAQYMTKSETAQSEIAKTNTEIRDALNVHIEKTDRHLSKHDSEIAVLNFVSGLNGRPVRAVSGEIE